MSVFDNITRRVTDTAKAAARKSSELVEVTKLNISIASEEEKIEKVFTEIGKAAYEAIVKEEALSNDAYKEQCEKITSLRENIKAMQQKILELKNVKVCSFCGAELEFQIEFCPKCGNKLETEEVKEEVKEPTEKNCSSCGAANELESAFCTKCGTKLDE